MARRFINSKSTEKIIRLTVWPPPASAGAGLSAVSPAEDAAAILDGFVEETVGVYPYIVEGWFNPNLNQIYNGGSKNGL
jgi:hypothetical protein